MSGDVEVEDCGEVEDGTCWWVYLLRCSDDSLYCGITKNVERRLEEHRRSSRKGSKYVRSRLPADLVYSEAHPTKSEALQREAEIKSWSRARKETFLDGQE